MRSKKVLVLFLLFVSLFFSTGCQFLKSPDSATGNDSTEGYYSIKGFLDDQWALLNGEPIVLLRVATFNGKKDSSYVKFDSALWVSIRKQFDPSDISDPRFLNQYKFTLYSDNSLNLDFINYEALNKDLFTRSLNMSFDNENHKIKSIFIETRKMNGSYEKSQKLTYMPYTLIRIQTFEKSIISSPENLSVSYYFKF